MEKSTNTRSRHSGGAKRGGSGTGSAGKNKRRRPGGSRGGASRGKGGGNSQRRHSGGNGRNRGRGRSGGGRKIPTFDPSRFINTNPVEIKEEVFIPQHQFDQFGLDDRIVSLLKDMNIITPTPIQDETIAQSLLGKDVVGLAETGTGKTAAFLIPLIQKTLLNKDHQTLILAPTRELAIQIDQELHLLSKQMKMFSVVCVGGINIRPQISNLRRRHNFVIGTPGRVLDLIERGNIRPSVFNAVVLDEADRMLDMGFIHDMKKILKNTPADRQTLFFSATMNKATENLIGDFLNNPVVISVKKKDVTNSIEQNVVPHGHHDKFETLTNLLAGEEFKRVIIFGAMKHSVEKLSRALTAEKIPSQSIHGNKSHPQRQRALNIFKNGRARVLVATDVAARGIHVDDVTHVINYDLPQTFEDYVHRIGRTGRGKKRGKALTFIPENTRGFRK